MAAESVCVGVRVRPYNAREKGLNAELCIDMNGPTTTITNLDTKEGKPFRFDESFWSHDGCEELFQLCPDCGAEFPCERVCAGVCVVIEAFCVFVHSCVSDICSCLGDVWTD